MCSLFLTDLRKLNVVMKKDIKKVVISGTFALLERTEFNSLNLVLKKVFLLHCQNPCYALIDCLVKYTLKT